MPLILTEKNILTVDSADNLQQFYKSRYLEEIFVFNDYLYLVKAGRIYQYNNGKFKLLDIFASFQSYQFCDIVYIVEDGKLCALNSDLTRNSIIDDQFEVILLCSSIIDLKNVKGCKVKVFDMLNITLQEGQNQQFDDYFGNLLELGTTGLKLKDNLLFDLFGVDYSQQVDILQKFHLVAEQCNLCKIIPNKA
ncbi:Conserved_hypothetical protein [Hexamita inflata]|uniref:Uncharacterized protein n=1 Tax=Hexamita inflata TaxID=28002 RepID=A0AA86PZH5_9EUKA|nr:Conserved hypothetical protein [Hexamita inflata]